MVAQFYRTAYVILIAAIAAVATLIAPGSPAAASEPNPFPSGKVDVYGAPDRLIVQGCQTFKAQDVREALMADWEVLLASAPSGQLDEYVGAIRAQLRYGYLAAGFDDVEVSVGADAEHETVVASVKEGTRYRCGPVHVVGNHHVSAESLIAKLTHANPPKSISTTRDADGTIHYGMDITDDTSSADWEPGDYADFSPTNVFDLNNNIKSGLADAGFNSATFTWKMQKDGATESLEITIADEGPQATLGAVTIKGMKADRRDEVLKFLDLREGQAIGLDQITRAQMKLWESGRFKKHLVTIAPIGQDSKLAVTFELMEFDDLPSLDQPLSAGDQGLLKFREWILTRAKAGEDIALKLDLPEQGDLKLAVNFGPAGGTFRFRSAGPLGPTTAPSTRPAGKMPPVIDAAFAMAGDRFGLYDVITGKKLVIWTNSSAAIDVYLKLISTVEADGTPSLTSNMNYHIQTDLDHPGLRMHFDLSPSVFIGMGRKPYGRTSVKDGIITLGGNFGSLQIDAASGRPSDGKIEVKGGSMEIGARKGAVKEDLDSLEKTFAGPNSWDEKQPFVSIAAFAADEWMLLRGRTTGSHADNNRAALAMRKLVTPQVLEPLSRLHAWRGSDLPFYIPNNPAYKRGGNIFGSFLTPVALPMCDQLFDRGSWPWVLTREQFLVLAGRRENLGPELDRILASHEIGPVGKLLTSALIAELSVPASSTAASSGLHDLNIKAFDKDVAVITQGDSVSAELVRRLADSLRHLPQEDVDALADTLNPEYAKIFQTFVTSLKSRPDEPIGKALPDALDDLWPDLIHAAVQAGLQAYVPGA